MSDGGIEHRRRRVPGFRHGLERRRRRRELRDELESRFQPLRPASLPRLILAAIFGPLVWALCILVAVLWVKPTDEILLGVLVAVLAFLIAVIVLLLLRRGRVREERNHVESA
jgi:hypothetical protein